jgi:hypothetical protein
MAIIHCGFVPHQNIFYKLRLISKEEYFLRKIPQRNLSLDVSHNLKTQP